MLNKKNSLNLLFTAESISAFSGQIILYIIPILSVLYHSADTFKIGILNSLESVSVLVFSIISGIYVDRFGSFNSLTISNIFKLLSAISLFGAIPPINNIIFIYISALFFGLGMVLSEASVTTATVQFIGKNEYSLNKANSFLHGIDAIASIAGPGVGGFLVVYMGYYGGLITSSTLFLFTSIITLYGYFLWRQKDRKNSINFNTNIPENKITFWETCKIGLRYIFRNKTLKLFTISSANFNFFSAFVQSSFIVFCAQELLFNEVSFSILGTVTGIFGIMGVFLMNFKFITNNSKIFYIISLSLPSLMVLTIIILPIFSLPHFINVLIVSFAKGIWSICMVICVVLFNTIRQILSPEGDVGKIASAERFIAIGGELPGALLGGFLGIQFSSYVPMIIGLFGMFISIFWVIKIKNWNNFKNEVPA